MTFNIIVRNYKDIFLGGRRQGNICSPADLIVFIQKRKSIRSWTDYVNAVIQTGLTLDPEAEGPGI